MQQQQALQLKQQRPSKYIALFSALDFSDRKMLLPRPGHGSGDLKPVSRETQVLHQLELFEARGPEAFEEAPGLYIRDPSVSRSSHPPILRDLSTGTLLDHIPVSCRWIRTLGPDNEVMYVNGATLQVLYTRPKALAWVLRSTADGETFWYK